MSSRKSEVLSINSGKYYAGHYWNLASEITAHIMGREEIWQTIHTAKQSVT